VLRSFKNTIIFADPLKTLAMIAGNSILFKPIKNIILAEDDIDDQNIFQLALQEVNSKINIQFVSNGKELLQLLLNADPDILFLDLEMPYKNGLECLVEIRSNKKFENLPVIVFSSTTKPSNVQTAYEMGANLFFIKPAVYSEYLSSIQALLKLNWNHPDQVKEQYCINGRYTAFN